MSQKATRKSQNVTIVIEDKERTDSPVKEMKKKIAANAEKEKIAGDKADKPAEKNDKTEPADKSKPAEKTEKTAEKPDKNEKSEKVADKKSDKPENKNVEKKVEKSAEKKAEQAEKKEESKADKSKEKPAKAVNGNHVGASAANGDDSHTTVSDSSDVELVIEEDEVFPELTYDDSDTDAFEGEVSSRSLTRRSQVKATKTPETPRPASEKEKDTEESKLLKLKEDAASVGTSDRKLRSADSPKPDNKKIDKKPHDSPQKQDQPNQEEEKKTPSKKDLEESEKEEQKVGKNDEKIDKLNLDVVIELDNIGEPPAQASRSRARVSPYSRSRTDLAGHDVTHTSGMADYTGNNSTMEMDITATSLLEEPSLDDSGYLRGLRAIRGRTSYKVLHDLRLTNPNANRPRTQPLPVLPSTLGRPTGAVVGRKRKPSEEEAAAEELVAERAVEAIEEEEERRHGKRMKLFDRLSLPFRRSGVTHRAADIVGINTDLPLTAPVAAAPLFDPETIKPSASVSTSAVPQPLPIPQAPRDNRCRIM